MDMTTPRPTGLSPQVCVCAGEAAVPGGPGPAWPAAHTQVAPTPQFCWKLSPSHLLQAALGLGGRGPLLSREIAPTHSDPESPEGRCSLERLSKRKRLGWPQLPAAFPSPSPLHLPGWADTQHGVMCQEEKESLWEPPSAAGRCARPAQGGEAPLQVSESVLLAACLPVLSIPGPCVGVSQRRRSRRCVSTGAGLAVPLGRCPCCRGPAPSLG